MKVEWEDRSSLQRREVVIAAAVAVEVVIVVTVKVKVKVMLRAAKPLAVEVEPPEARAKPPVHEEVPR